jgi:SAM-dependent methyltransferase
MALTDYLDAPAYYDRDAERFAARYDSVAFDAVHLMLARYLPRHGRALDVGAGSGRDARAMAARGLDVTAAEPSAGLRAIGAAKDARVRWIDERLPDLAAVRRAGERYDFILCSAVLMLVPPAELGASLATMADLLAQGGRLGVNLRAPRPDEPAGLFFDHGDAALLTGAKTTGLVCLDRGEAEDAIGRDGYLWRSFMFERPH